jgi:hypothetical protein
MVKMDVWKNSPQFTCYITYLKKELIVRDELENFNYWFVYFLFQLVKYTYFKSL